MPPLWGKVPAIQCLCPTPCVTAFEGSSTMKPLPTEIAPKSNRAGRISVQFQIARSVTVASKKKGHLFHHTKKSLPHGQVLEEFFVQLDVVEAAGYPLGPV